MISKNFWNLHRIFHVKTTNPITFENMIEIPIVISILNSDLQMDKLKCTLKRIVKWMKIILFKFFYLRKKERNVWQSNWIHLSNLKNCNINNCTLIGRIVKNVKFDLFLPIKLIISIIVKILIFSHVLFLLIKRINNDWFVLWKH